MARRRDDDAVPVEFKYKPLTNDSGRAQAGVEGTCTRCGNTEQSFGESERSKNRCLALMRENCPEGESNYYVAEDRGLEDDD